MAVPVILMCCREVTMSALREWAASASSSAHKVGACCCAVVEIRGGPGGGGVRTLGEDTRTHKGGGG
jgi:hypothetical protein